jgi:hypothetical protein
LRPPRHFPVRSLYISRYGARGPEATGIPRDAGGQCTRLGIASCLAACAGRARSGWPLPTRRRRHETDVYLSQRCQTRLIEAARPTGRSRRPRGASRRSVRIGAAGEGTMVGRGGLEPPTSRLSGVRSNHLSYRPGPGDACHAGNGTWWSLPGSNR